jgi:hypothetical protein
MKFLIQKIDNEIKHDFSFTLMESIRFKEWLGSRINVKFLNSKTEDKTFEFKPMHSKYVPIGSVEFVSEYLKHFYGLTPKPINIPQELFQHVYRPVFNGTEKDALKLVEGKWFIKSNDKIKGYKEEHKVTPTKKPILPEGNYQFSEHINIDSEWRAFVYQGKLVGLQHYSGEFTVFPNVAQIKYFIARYDNAPIAYTLDVSVEEFKHCKTDVIEVHDFFSCGLYGFINHAVLPNMYYRWFIEYLQRNNVTRLF